MAKLLDTNSLSGVFHEIKQAIAGAFDNLTDEQKLEIKGDTGATGATGPQGPQGDSFQPIEDVSGLVLANTLGQDNSKAISQKGITDAINAETINISIDAANAVATNRYLDSTKNKWIKATSTQYGYIFEVKPNAWYERARGSYSTAYAWLKEGDFTLNQTPNYAGSQTNEAWWGGEGYPSVVQAPSDAKYIYFRILTNGIDYTPAYWKLRKSVVEKVSEIDNALAAVESELEETTIDTSSLTTSSVGIFNDNTWGNLNPGNNTMFLPVTPGQWYSIESNGSQPYKACFITSAEKVIGEMPNYAGGQTEMPIYTWEKKYVKAPSDAAFIFMVNDVYNIGNRRPIIKQVGEKEGRLAALENKKKSVRILYIGNSMTQDGVSYLPKLLKEIAPELDFKFYMWYIASLTLSQQYQKFLNGDTASIFSICENDTAWTNYSNLWTMENILETFEFDIVVLQEYENNIDTVSAEPFENCVSYIRAHYNKPFKVACLLHPPKRTDIDNAYQKAVAVNKLILKETEAETVIDCGASIMLAMNTELDQLGDRGHLTPDDIHTQEGLPCLLQTYVHAQWLFRQLAMAHGVTNSQLRITTAIYNAINVPGPNIGTGVITGTDAQHVIAQKCAVNADKLAQALEAEAFSEISEL